MLNAINATAMVQKPELLQKLALFAVEPVKLRSVSRSVFGQFVNITTCNNCNGEGTVIDTPCKKCMGDGRIQA